MGVFRDLHRRHGQEQQDKQDTEGQIAERQSCCYQHGDGLFVGQRRQDEHNFEL